MGYWFHISRPGVFQRLLLVVVILSMILSSLLFIRPISAATTDPNCTQQIVLPGTTTPGWLQMPSLAPAFHVEGSNAVVGGKVFLFTGFDTNALTAANRIDVYNPSTDIWETVASPRGPMPFAASHIQAVNDGQFIWMVGGFYGNHPSVNPSNLTWRYDPVNDLWATNPLWNLPEGRAAGGLVLNGRNMHFFGGISDTTLPRNTQRAEHWFMNIDNPDAGWQATTSLPVARLHLNGVAIDGIIYAIGGQFAHDTNPVDVNLVDAFEATGLWTPRAPLARPRSHFEPGTIVMNDRIIIVGGRDNAILSLSDVSEYNPQTNTWTELTPLPVALIAPTAKALGSYIVVTEGGRRYDDAQNNTWIGEVLTDCVIASIVTPTPNPDIGGRPISSGGANDVLISKSGVLQSGGVGLPGERITWTVNITNNSGAAQHVTMTDTLIASLTLDGTQASKGTVSTSGQTVTVNIASLLAGETATVTINTTIRERSASGIFINTALLNNGRSATAEVRVVPSVSQLPATGESPQERWVLVGLLMGALAGCGFGAMLLQKSKTVA